MKVGGGTKCLFCCVPEHDSCHDVSRWTLAFTQYGNCAVLRVVITVRSVLAASRMSATARKFGLLNGHPLQTDTLNNSVSGENIYDLKRVVRQSTP